MKDSSSQYYDAGVLSNPLSFLRSGYFSWNSAGLGGRGGGSYYWSLRSVNTTNSNGLNFSDTYLNHQYVNNRGYGFAVRYVKIGRAHV